VPTYVYRCVTCDDDFELDRPMSQSSDPAACPSGHTKTMRKLTGFTSVTANGTTPVKSGPPAAAGGCGGACACH
jgi:putative FmdB family regulatory protein